ncbi:EEIG1/EHBP1 N-terminal domain-containing protein [Cunninghamella echinulata]|nr:EEIG1/EHBP1 N-terminal domain-containing protein [Cunninghamella echinulata]
MSFSHFFISKNRKIDFELDLDIHDITNVPLVSGSYFVKWKLKNATQSSGITTNIPINDHTVIWRHSVKTQCELVISKQHLLMPCELKLEIYQEIGGSNLKQIGALSLNISEYATLGHITKRYLLEECKFNSLIKVRNI